MIERSVTFQDKLIMSEGTIANKAEDIKSFLLAKIPLAVKVERANLSDDKKGIDYWVTLQSGRIIGVDVKARDEDWSKRGYDDVALETWSVIEKKIIGWTRNPDKQTDYILFIWQDTGRFMLLSFPAICSIFQEHWEMWRKKFKVAIQRTENSPSSQWHSECVFVPRMLICNTIHHRYGGCQA